MNKLITQLKKKRSKAQYRLYQLYADYLYRICFRYMNNHDDAHDALSKSFLNVFEHINNTSIENEIVLKAWMKKITINQCLMELRKRKMFFMELELIYAFEKLPINYWSSFTDRSVKGGTKKLSGLFA